MEKWRIIEDEEFDREWRPVRNRLFREDGHAGDKESPFLDSSWRSVPMPSFPFCGYFGLGDGTRPDEFPPVEPFVKDHYEPLYLTLAEFGIDHIVVDICDEGFFTTQGGKSGRYYPMLLSPTVEAFREANNQPCVFFDTDIAPLKMYSREATWGLSHIWEDCTLLGGTPEFIETFYRIVGGERAARARYLYFQLAGGCALPYGEMFSRDYYMTRKPLTHMYDQAGWPWPNRWSCWSNEKIDWSWMMDDEGFPET